MSSLSSGNRTPLPTVEETDRDIVSNCSYYIYGKYLDVVGQGYCDGYINV